MTTNHAAGLLHFLVNNRTLFPFLEGITGCARIQDFDGRVYRMLPGGGHYDTWHNDMTENRMVGMSVNLGSAPYGGGLFQLRYKASGQMIHEAANTGFGDAILFRLDYSLQHRVTNVEGSVSKLAYAGWFRSAGGP